MSIALQYELNMGRKVIPMTIERFQNMTMPIPESGCWIWMGGVGRLPQHGYGRVHVPGTYETVNAHRMAWELHKGKIPKGKLVLHKCDVRCCVNPDHLYVGDYKDNAQDMVSRKRNPKWMSKVCKRGHPRTPENTLKYKCGNMCKICFSVARNRANQKIKDRKLQVSHAR